MSRSPLAAALPRYGELAAALPGIASNLLADRLKALVASGVVERRLDGTAGAVTYALTPWGEQLRDVVDSLVRWSGPLMAPGPADADAFDARWLQVALCALLRDRRRDVEARVGLDVGGELLEVAVGPDGLRVAPTTTPPRTTLRADADVLLGLAAGALAVDEAVARGELRGSARPLRDVFAGSRRARS